MRLRNYLLAGNPLESVDNPGSVVALLGVDHRRPEQFRNLIAPSNIQMSEVYEFAKRVNKPDSTVVPVTPFKLVLSQQLAEQGKTDEAKRYLTMTSAFAKAAPHKRISDAAVATDATGPALLGEGKKIVS